LATLRRLAAAVASGRRVRHAHFGVGHVVAEHGQEFDVDVGERGQFRVSRQYLNDDKG
jgi:hypothetical protein